MVDLHSYPHTIPEVDTDFTPSFDCARCGRETGEAIAACPHHGQHCAYHVQAERAPRIPPIMGVLLGVLGLGMGVHAVLTRGVIVVVDLLSVGVWLGGLMVAASVVILGLYALALWRTGSLRAAFPRVTLHIYNREDGTLFERESWLGREWRRTVITGRRRIGEKLDMPQPTFHAPSLVARYDLDRGRLSASCLVKLDSSGFDLKRGQYYPSARETKILMATLSALLAQDVLRLWRRTAFTRRAALFDGGSQQTRRERFVFTLNTERAHLAEGTLERALVHQFSEQSKSVHAPKRRCEGVTLNDMVGQVLRSGSVMTQAWDRKHNPGLSRLNLPTPRFRTTRDVDKRLIEADTRLLCAAVSTFQRQHPEVYDALRRAAEMLFEEAHYDEGANGDADAA